MEPSPRLTRSLSYDEHNLQHYSGESGLSYLSQMLVIIFMMFVSASSGYAACVGVFPRPRRQDERTASQLLRGKVVPTHPSVIGGLLLVWRAFRRTLMQNSLSIFEGAFQTIAMGPMGLRSSSTSVRTAAGLLGADSRQTPLETPTILSNLIELYSMMLMPGALCYHLW